MYEPTTLQERSEYNKGIELRLRSIIRGIVAHEWSLDVEDSEGLTALQLVAECRGECQLSVMPRVDTFDDAMELPLNPASALAIARLLLDSGAKVDHREELAKPPLYIAARNDNLKMASILLEYGANPKIEDEYERRTALHIVSSAEMAELLLENGAPIDPEDRYKHTPLRHAVEYDHLTVVPVLLKYGADVSSRDYNRAMPLHFAESPRIAELLLRDGAEVDAKNRDGMTALHLASLYDFLGVIQVLVEFGADINAKDGDGRTALHLVHESATSRDTVRLLVKLGADVNAEDNDGYTALQEAVKFKEDRLLWALLEQDVEHRCPRAARTDPYLRGHTSIAGFISASIELKTAGLECTRDNFKALNGRKYGSSKSAHRNRYGRFKQGDSQFKLGCEAELETLKNHMVTKTMSLHAFMLIDNVHCVFNKPLLDAPRSINFKTYPIYKNFLTSKFNKLDLMVTAMERFNVLLRAGRTNVWYLPEELVVKILAHLDSSTMKNVLSCSNSVMKRRYAKRTLEDAARADYTWDMQTRARTKRNCC